MYRKWVDGPRTRPVLFLVHGSSFCARTGYDLAVPGRDDYSMMDHFARAGFDVWTLDHEGYGRSTVTERNSDIACGVEDLRAGMEVVRRETGVDRAMLYGASSGALRAAAYAAAEPARVERLVLDAFVWTGEGSPTLAKRREQLDFWRSNSRRPVDRAFFHSIFNRDKPGTSEPAVAEALADAELALTDSVPTGTYLDMCANLPVVDPTTIHCPVQIVRGEHDGIATEDDLLAFYRRLPTKDKHFVVLSGQAHVGPLGLNRHRFWHVIRAFLELAPGRG
ncbi:MAG: alpha/beta hydrolase [Ectothiorhodospiraceae bacterium]|nr:alpha/beta hydrolase [Ectothiorhodospiraceae bacterium]